MKITHMSASSLNTYETCPQKYFIKYILNIQDTVGAAAFVGKIVHKVLECMALCHKNKIEFVDKEIGQISFVDYKSESFITSLIVRTFEHYNKEFNGLLDKSHMKDCIKLVNKVLTFKNGLYNPINLNIVDAEQVFELELNTLWCKELKLRGVIDLVTSPMDGIVEIIDYKSGRRFDWLAKKEKNFENLVNDLQLQIYFYAAKKLYPNINNFIITIIYIKDGGPISIPFSDITLQKLESKLESLFREISECELPKLLSPTRQGFMCSKLCHFAKAQYGDSGKSVCEFVHDEIIKHGINQTEKLYAKEREKK